MILSDGMRGRLRATADAKADRRLAATLRARDAEAVAHLDDAALAAEIGHARAVADHLGIAGADLRARFIELGVARLPRFWEDPDLWRMLTATPGTPDVRFGDVLGLIRVAARRAGKADGMGGA